MATEDFRKGYLGIPSTRAWTFENLAGRIARDRLFGTNHTGYNPKPDMNHAGWSSKPNPLFPDTERRAVNRAAIAATSPSPVVRADPRPRYYSSPAMIPGTTFDNDWQGTADNSDCSYTGESGLEAGPFGPQWWLDTGAFSAWEDFGAALTESWGVRIGFGLAAGLVALIIALANSWPGAGTLVAVSVGGIAGMIAPVLLGYAILILRAVAGLSLAVVTSLVAIAVVGLVVIFGIRMFASKPAAVQPAVSYSSPAAVSPSPVHRHPRKGKHHTQDWNLEDALRNWTPPSEKTGR